MKKTIRWALRMMLMGLFLLGLFVCFILRPSFLYAHKTIFGNYTIYHSSTLDPLVQTRLYEATKILKSTELYDVNLKYDICLNDGSWYPSLIKTILNEPIGTTFYNKIVFLGTINFKENYGLENNRKWNLTQFIAHAQIHCLQFNKLGLWKSNPIADYPNWKWEGYAEYISRKTSTNNDLNSKIEDLIQAQKTRNKNWIEFTDGTGSSITFYKRQLLVQFCSDIKRMNFDQLLNDSRTEEIIIQEMMSWYKSGLQSNQSKLNSSH